MLARAGRASPTNAETNTSPPSRLPPPHPPSPRNAGLRRAGPRPLSGEERGALNRRDACGDWTKTVAAGMRLLRRSVGGAFVPRPGFVPSSPAPLPTRWRGEGQRLIVSPLSMQMGRGRGRG